MKSVYANAVKPHLLEVTLLDYGELPHLQESIRKETSSIVAEYTWVYELTSSLPFIRVDSHLFILVHRPFPLEN